MTLKQLSFKVITTLSKLKLTISSCESFTGGAFGDILTDIPGSSSVYQGGYIAYSTTMKELLGIDSQLITKYGVVSPEIAKAMAQQTHKQLKTNFSVAFTGNAGPQAQSGVDVGIAFIAISFNDEELILKLEAKQLNREEFKNFAIEQVLTIIWKIIQ